MMEITGTTGFRVGILAMDGVDSARGEELRREREALEARLRAAYGALDRAALKVLHPMDAYAAYYRRFGCTYHVLPQLESVAKGKPIPEAPPAVQAMFMAELKNALLTAGHDMDALRLPLRLIEATGGECYTALSGKPASAVPGDAAIEDGEAVISSVLRGPDRRTAISGETRRALYTVYAPSGVEEELIARHLSDIEGYLRACSSAVTLEKRVY